MKKYLFVRNYAEWAIESDLPCAVDKLASILLHAFYLPGSVLLTLSQARLSQRFPGRNRSIRHL